MRRAVALLAVLAASASAQEWAVTPGVLAAADGAPVVVRHYATEYDVDGPGRATTRVRLVATALTAAGREAVGELNVVHGGFRELRRFEGTLFDADGREVRRLGRRDAERRRLGSLYEDLEVRSAALYGDRLPFTVEWTYEIEHRGVLGWPTWRPQRSGWPVEEATFTLSTPTGTAVRTLARDIVPPTERFGERARDVRTWRAVQIPRAAVEPFGPPAWEQLPELRLGTDAFEIGGARGRLDTWAGLGAWYDGLDDDRQRLPDAAVAEVRRIVEGAATDAERARRLYRHLQETTRYVSIQLGLGGWQPFDAAYVFERRYGDCKALTNYMMAMLAAVGIEADPVLIEAGDDGTDLDPAFPQNVFNHVILRVPLDYAVPALAPDGAVWLECTSPFAAFGQLGSFTEDRPGLLVDGAASRIVRTPAATPDLNWARLDADLALDARGRASGAVRWALHGEPRTDAVAALADAAEVDRAATLRALAGVASADVADADVGAVEARPDTLHLAATLTVPGVARRAGSRLLVGLAPLSAPVAVPPAADAPRRHPVRLGPAVARRDSVRIALPAGYAVEGDLEPVEIVGPVGRYALRATAADGALVVVRELVIDAPTQPAEAYDAVREFLEAVARADGTRAIARRE